MLCEYFNKNTHNYKLPKALFKGKILKDLNKIPVPGEGKRKYVKGNVTRRIECMRSGIIFTRNKDKLRNVQFNKDGTIKKVSSKNEGDVLSDGYNSFTIGKGSIRNATRKQKYKKPPLDATIQYAQNKDIFDSFECDVEKAIIINGCYHSNKYTLIRQLTPENLDGDHYLYPNIENLQKFDDSIRVLLRKIKNYETIEQFSIDDMLDCEFDGAKKPGYTYEEEFGLNTKEESVQAAYKIARKRWKYASKFSGKDISSLDRSKIFPGYYTIGARNKRDATYEEGEVPNSRVIHMPEFHCEMTSAPWCDAITDSIKFNGAGPIYIGNSILDWHRLNKDICDSTYVIEGDWRRFDSTLYIKMITMVVSLMRTFYPLDSEYIDKHFLMLYDSLAFKDYHLPGGKFIRALHGLASGVKSTSLVNSIANLIALIYCVGPKQAKNFNFIVGGDDFLVSRKANSMADSFESFELQKKMEVKSSELGMEFKFLKNKFYNSNLIEECPVFYKYCIYKRRPVVPTSSVLERCFMPWNKDYSNSFKYLSFLEDVRPSLGTPLSHLLLYYKAYRDILYCITGIKVQYSEIIKSHQRSSDAMFMRKIFSPSLLTYFTGEDLTKKKDVAHLLSKNDHNKGKQGIVREFLRALDLKI